MSIMPSVYCNFDHQLDNEVLEKLKKGELTEVAHSAWNFYANITFKDGEFTSRIQQHGATMEIQYEH